MMKFLRTQMKWIMAIIVVAFLLSTFLMYEGRGTRRTPSRNPDGTMADYEVAQINGRSLMRSELEQRLRNYLSTYSTRSMTSIDMPAIYRSVLDQAILESQLAKEVQEKGITVSDAEADMAMKSYADTYFPTREAFYQVLANSGLKPEDYKRNLARQMAADRLVREAIGEVTISEASADAFYETMKPILYARPEGFMIHMADFRTSADADAFRAMLEGGASWDVLASGDALASMDVINITKSPIMLPASAFTTGTLSVLASLDVGTLTPVFEIVSGDFAVGMKSSHVEAGNTPYDEVSADIKTLLTQQEERNRLTAYEASLMQRANVVINDTELFASPATQKDDEQSADILPMITVEETSGDEVVATETAIVDTVSGEPEPETPATASEDAPATVTVIEETPEVVAVIEESPDTVAVIEETPETVTVIEETPEAVTVIEETPAVVTASEDTPATVTIIEETPATETVTESTTPAETVSTESAPETPATVETPAAEAPTETPGVETVTETVTVTEASPDKQ